ncbi:MAG: YbhB/YbcL family Raf kinase inhibitor-like protein [Candidatus Berkelbacteria bacterium]|nr:YbhB/YbcL family Raf kinase inhibitor-like protein [Candidatus Berkelbacteria bacterium]
MKLISESFVDGGEMPPEFSCQGDGRRPDLSWSEIPAGTKGLAISVVDPDAPGGDFVHWLVANIPASVGKISAGDQIGQEMPNSTGQNQYIPPCPPSGRHRYIFTLYALDSENISGEDFFAEIENHLIEKSTLTGLYQKS